MTGKDKEQEWTRHVDLSWNQVGLALVHIPRSVGVRAHEQHSATLTLFTSHRVRYASRRF